MSPQAKWEYMKTIYNRYHQNHNRKEKSRILDEFCRTYECHRKHALRLLNAPPPPERRPRRLRRKALYSHRVISILESLWEATGYLWSVRLKAALPLWLPWIRERFRLTQIEEHQLLSISSAQIDRRLKEKKYSFRKKIYGKTKPGGLLKHQIPIQTSSWNIKIPGYMEADLVSHSGNSASGTFAYTLDVTDLATQWVERRAFLGKSQEAVFHAIQEIEWDMPFDILGFDSDNDSPFINAHLLHYCQTRHIQFTRSRPYQKNDNAHIEQKNWTHVRQLMGYLRYDTQEAIESINELYINELNLFQNFFQPSVKLIKKVRVGSRIKRVYDAPKTPFQRLLLYRKADPQKIQRLKTKMNELNPFVLSETIDQKLHRIFEMASQPPGRALHVRPASRRLLRHDYRKMWNTNIFPELTASSSIDSYSQLQQKEKFLQTW